MEERDILIMLSRGLNMPANEVRDLAKILKKENLSEKEEELISLLRVAESSSYEELKEAQKKAPWYKYSQKLATIKIARLIDSIEEIKEEYKKTPHVTELRKIVIARWLDIVIEQIQKSDNKENILGLYRKIPENVSKEERDIIKAIIIKKIYSLI